ncbi:hypothetical protein D9615_009596 [Tricholomella constricta]|uniref:Uncharacterized protein n=1 Tax=Tricholomella constricta TaxID=117010 RepID=A0A8H5LVV6_9AGAR|nr:hypothetical protein D9615_009596 [Tricholomella constricta]
MRQTPEAKAFLRRIISLPKGPGISLDEVLRPSLDDEAELRKLFATYKDHVRLSDPLVGLVDVFDAPANVRTTRARIVKDDQELSAKYVMPLSKSIGGRKARRVWSTILKNLRGTGRSSLRDRYLTYRTGTTS